MFREAKLHSLLSTVYSLHMPYIFHLGRETNLCLAELRSFYPDAKDLHGFALVQEADLTLLNRLGGTIKISEVIKELPASLPLNFSELIGSEITKLAPKSGKFKYGISIHPSQTGLLKNLLKAAKNALKSAGVSSRYLNQDAKNLSSIQAANCTELSLIFTDAKTFLTKTVATQDIASYSKRDYDRPARDSLSGMLPPKLAQMMINLANPSPDTVIYDPFCGSGTILQEAMLMGLSCKGSDLSEKAVTDSKENIEWIKRECRPKGQCLSIEEKDATKLTSTDFRNKKIAIVAESYLGPPKQGIPTEEEAMAALSQLEPLYIDFLRTEIPPRTEIVLALPFVNLRPNPIFLENFIEKAKELGYSVVAAIPPLTYARRNQVIGRMIARLRKE